ncbi:MAG: acetoacetyl-CoA synthase [Halioglobus sp.]|nr:acetoacetyl-CoA synthase [Halioglobus sp.]|tara:strand:- start:7174 stop:7419 length:246 start_codon:yes stop_codon:yes gene_type:complete
MDTLFDADAPKKPTNLSVNSDLLSKSRALDINLSATLEQALQAKLAQASAENWRKDNRKAIKAYNDFVEENGCFGTEYQEF